MTLCVLYSFVEAADTVLYSSVQSCTVHTAQLSCESARGRVQSWRAQRTPSRPAELDTRQPVRSQEGLSNPEPVCLNVNTSVIFSIGSWAQHNPGTRNWCLVKWSEQAGMSECMLKLEIISQGFRSGGKVVYFSLKVFFMCIISIFELYTFQNMILCWFFFQINE